MIDFPITFEVHMDFGHPKAYKYLPKMQKSQNARIFREVRRAKLIDKGWVRCEDGGWFA